MSDRPDALRLAELLSARISHDLSGAIGTLAAALELAVDETPDPSEALTLAADAADELRSRLKLLRAAWGPDTGALRLAELRALAAGLGDSGRLTIDFAALPRDTVFPPATARVVLNLLLLARESLPAGGLVTLMGTAADLTVGIAGARAAWPAGLPRCLASEAGAWAAVQDARSLQLPLTALLARALGLRLSLLLAAGPADGVPMLRLSES